MKRNYGIKDISCDLIFKNSRLKERHLRKLVAIIEIKVFFSACPTATAKFTAKTSMLNAHNGKSCKRFQC